MSTDRSRPPIWTQPAPGSRRPRWSREQIAEVGLRIADVEGFEALSMRRLADELGAGTMTLYHYVRTKEDLVALLDDAIMAEVLIPAGEMPTAWRPALAAIARSSHGAFERHPWALQALQSARFGPNGMRHFDQSLAAVATTGLPLGDRMMILNIVDDFVFGHTFRVNDKRTRQSRDRRTMGAIVDYTTTMLATGEFPHIAAVLGGLSTDAAWRKIGELIDDAGRFERGLATILDGIALRWHLPDDDAAPPPVTAPRSPRSAPSAATPDRGGRPTRGGPGRRR